MTEQITAFPVPPVNLEGGGFKPQSPGMSLRDWFAGQALGHLISGRDWSGLSDDQDTVNSWVAAAYTVADAMMVERDK